ncbi:glycosyltransferase [Vibrio scophthalmi]|uniref:glycosyltransferase n=1 Tax=Vibrio scophthalmi TaxID=45658 RepID=UPI003872F981
MKVLHIITGLGIGGAETMLYKLLCQLSQDKNSKHLVISLIKPGPYKSKINKLGIEVISLDMHSVLSLPVSVSALMKIVRDIRPDVVQGWMYHGNLFASICKLVLPKSTKIIWNIRHSLYDFSKESTATKWLIKFSAKISGFCNHILYNSSISRIQHEQAGFSSAHGKIIPNGFNTEIFRPNAKSKAEIRNELEIGNDVKVIVHIGRFHPAKNHLGFVKAVVPVLEQHKHVEVIMVGLNVDQNNEQITSIIPPTLISRVHLLGLRHDIPALMTASDMLVMSSDTEGFPNVIGEAMSSGLPVVTTDVGASRIVVGEAGIVVPIGDMDALRKGVLSFIELEKKAFDGLKAKSRVQIIRDYSLDAIALQYKELYERK